MIGGRDGQAAGDNGDKDDSHMNVNSGTICSAAVGFETKIGDYRAMIRQLAPYGVSQHLDTFHPESTQVGYDPLEVGASWQDRCEPGVD